METETRPIRVVMTPHPLEHARSVVEILAFVIAALWGVYVFVYQEILKPANEPPRLETSVSVEHRKLSTGDVFVTVHVLYQNPGRSEIDIAAEALTVWGQQVSKRDAFRSSGGTEWEVSRSRDFGKRVLILDSGQLRNAVLRGDRDRRFVLAPAASGSQDYTFVIADKRFDVIDVSYATWFLRSNYGAKRIPLVRRQQPDGSSIIALDGKQEVEAYSSSGLASFPI